MSFQAMAWAVKQQLPTNEKFILIMLANYASNDEGECFPAIETLMRETSLARTTVRKCLHSLQTKGYISAHERWSNGRQLSNSYRMVVGWGEGSPHDHRGSPNDRGGSPHGPTGGRHTTPNLSEEPINQPKPKVDEAELTFDFEIFWAAYPKRPSNPKQPALTNGGAYAEFVTVPEGQALPIPKGFSMLQAAALPENFFTCGPMFFSAAS